MVTPDDDAPPLTDARLVHLAAQVLALVTQTRSLQADEHAAAGAPLERRAIAALVTGRASLAEAERVPLFAITGAPRLLAWTCALRASRTLGASSLRQRRRGAWRVVRGLVVEAPLRGLPGEAAVDLRSEAGFELDRAEEEATRPHAGAVAELAGSIDVRARAVGELLIPVLAAVQRGEPLLETGERLRMALRVWEG